jgi:uncharacterized protein (TIGR02594 family)
MHTEIQETPPWLAKALSEIGVKEAPGAADNPDVVKYYAAVKGGYSHDSVPWCSAFANWCTREAGIEGTHSAAARSWLEWGVELERPRVGCIVVLDSVTRGPKAGHVGFLMSQPDLRHVVLIGGNQGDRVCAQPFSVGRVLPGGYRWPAGVP